jgi:hypothetical protein
MISYYSMVLENIIHHNTVTWYHFAIVFSIIIFNVMPMYKFTIVHNITSWSTFTCNGITLGNKSHWKILYNSNYEIQTVNSSNPFNRFATWLPKSILTVVSKQGIVYLLQ